MSKPDTGPTPKGKRRVRVPFQPSERNVTQREYDALQRAGYIKADLPPKQAAPTPELASTSHPQNLPAPQVLEAPEPTPPTTKGRTKKEA